MCFSLLEKLFLSNLDSFSIPLDSFSIPLDSYAIYWDPSAAFYHILDSFSIATSIHRESLLWTPLDSSSIAKTRLLKLNNSRLIKVYEFSINRRLTISHSFPSISLDSFSLLSLPNTSYSSLDFWPKSSVLHLVWYFLTH